MRAFCRCSHHRYSIKDVLNNLAKFTEKHLCLSLFLIKLQTFRSSTLLKKETPTQVFSYEFCEIFKNTSPIFKNICDELLLLLTNCFSVFDHVVGLVLNNVNQHMSRNVITHLNLNDELLRSIKDRYYQL